MKRFFALSLVLFYGIIAFSQTVTGEYVNMLSTLRLNIDKNFVMINNPNTDNEFTKKGNYTIQDSTLTLHFNQSDKQYKYTIQEDGLKLIAHQYKGQKQNDMIRLHDNFRKTKVFYSNGSVKVLYTYKWKKGTGFILKKVKNYNEKGDNQSTKRI